MRSARAFGAQSLFFLAILYFTFFGGSFYSDFLLPVRVFHHLIVSVALIGWLLHKLHRGQRLPRTPLDAPIVACLTAVFVSALLGMHTRFSLEKLWTPFTWVLIFYLLIDLGQYGYISRVLRALYMGASVVCVVSVIELVSWYFGLPLLPQFIQSWPAAGSGQLIPPTLHRLTIAMNGPTPLSAYMALLIPLAIAVFLTARARDTKWAMLLWLAVAFVIELFSMSRGGILALLVSLPLTALIFLLARRGDSVPAATHNEADPLHTRALFYVKRNGMVLAVLVVLGALMATLGPLWARSTFAGRVGSTDFRFTLWQVALTTFRENPLVGVGPFNFGRSLLRCNDASLPRSQIMTAHNLYLNTAAETGLLGLIAGGWLLGSVARTFRERWQAASNVHERMRIGAVGAALAGFAAQNMVDTFTATPVILPVLILVAYVFTTPMTEHRQSLPLYETRTSPRGSRLITLVVSGILTLYTIGMLWWDGAQYYLQRSIRLAQERDWEDAIAAATLAHQMDPSMALHSFQLAYILSTADTHVDAADAQTFTHQAGALYQSALSAEPVHGRQSANLAATLWRQGDREGALSAMRDAVAADPAPILAINLGYFYQEIGDLPHAVAYYSRALASAPELAASQFWTADPVRLTQWPEIVRQAEQVVPAHLSLPRWRLLLALARQEWTEVEEHGEVLLRDLPTDCLALSAIARAHLTDAQLQDAMAATEQAIHADAACGEAYIVRGQIHSLQGHISAAERDWRIALFLGRSRAAYHLGQLYESRGDLHAAARFYRYALGVIALPADVEVVLYDRLVTFDLLPPLFNLGIGPEQAEPYLALGRLYQMQGDYVAARQLYEMLLRQDPYFLEAHKRLQMLEATR